MHTDPTPPVDPPVDHSVDPRLRELFQQLTPGPLDSQGTVRGNTARMHAALEAFRARRVNPAAAEPSRETGRVRRNERMGKSLAMIGVACLLIALGVGTWMARSGPSDMGAARTFVTKPGQRMTVRLADGSTMLLAPATTVSVSPTTVDVHGAAYFTVAPHASHPFTVRTSNAVVQVLGTRFEVRQFADEPVSRVVVEEGRVALQSLKGDQYPRPNKDASRAVASAGMLAEVSDSGVTVTSGISTQTLTGWTRGILVFDRIPLREVLAEVGRAYGANIRVVDSVLAEQPVFAEVNVMDRSLVQVLNSLSEALSAHYVDERGTFVVVPGRRAQSKSLPQPERQYGR